MITYSIIVPVYNRPNEVQDLLESLAVQTEKNFHLILVEDGSTEKSDQIAEAFKDKIDIKYYFKENSGPGDSRNFGMSVATGDYLIFFDSDCIIPRDYFAKVNKFLASNPLDCFGGPDAADESFSDVQKAINYAMTSVITTGGVRGKENKLDTYQPRSFNMGITKEVYDKVGGYSNIHPGEDPDLSYRIMEAGFKVGLIEEAFVYHKRRIDFSKFTKQVHKFGVVRPILIKWYPQHFKLTYMFPSIFLLGSVGLIVLGIILHWSFFLPLAFLTLILLTDALIKTKNIKIALMATIASYIQLYVYGLGFMKSYSRMHILKQDENKVYSSYFFKVK